MDEAVIEHFRDPYIGGFQLVFELPQIRVAFNGKRDVIEHEGLLDRDAVIFFRYVFHPGPFEEGDQVELTGGAVGVDGEQRQAVATQQRLCFRRRSTCRLVFSTCR